MQNRESAPQILTTLRDRWRGAATLEYRSIATLTHAGEPTLVAKLHAQLRRPRLARLVFEASNPAFSGVRVSEGRLVYHRSASTPLRPALTTIRAASETILSGISHPLDELGYSLEQFFSDRPFWPRGATPTTVVRRRQGDKEYLVLTIVQGVNQDTLTLEGGTYAPVSLVRVGDHGGEIQTLVREEFSDVVLAGPLAPSLFRWTREDDTRP